MSDESDRSEDDSSSSSSLIAEHQDPMVAHLVDQPAPFDVLLGRGRGNQQHDGNRRFQVLINEHQDAYNSFTSREEKTNTTRSIVHLIKSGGDQPGRFLKYNGTTSGWEEVSDEAARIKVAQALRYRREDVGASGSARAAARRAEQQQQQSEEQQPQQQQQYDEQQEQPQRQEAFVLSRSSAPSVASLPPYIPPYLPPYLPPYIPPSAPAPYAASSVSNVADTDSNAQNILQAAYENQTLLSNGAILQALGYDEHGHLVYGTVASAAEPDIDTQFSDQDE